MRKLVENLWNILFRRRRLILRHPESPGMKVVVHRRGIQTFFLNPDFATLSEAIDSEETLFI